MTSSIFDIASETIVFSILVSLFTVGVGALSQEGALLYPLRLYVERISTGSLGELYSKLKKYQEGRRQHRQAGNWVEPALKKIELKIFWRNAWHKPLFTCAMCMPSVWSTIIYWVIFNTAPLAVWLLGAPIAITLVLIINKIKR